jgi:hypothetical protein
MRRNIISIICSVIAWSVIMLLTGMFGSFAFAIGLIALKVIGSLLLLAFFIRIPIVLMEREDSKNLIKIKNKINEGVQASLMQVADSVKRSSINIVGRDNPLMPPDYDE